jgi:hypothetical protein
MSAVRDLLEARIERDQKELVAMLGGLRERVRAELCLGRRVNERPAAWLLGAALVGFWLGARRRHA